MTRFNPLDHPIMLRYPTRETSHNSWLGHIPFAFLLMELARPRLLVELGTYEGSSYGAFCQAVAELKLPTRCFGIDTWRGDSHQGEYGDEIFNNLSAFHAPRYAGFSTLLRKRFDDALGDFADGSIDLLHIDGLHTYEAVKHDYETWRPKLSQRAVVLFHDTSERKDDFGVWKLWGEVRETGPSFNFTHYHGLGVLAVGRDVAAGVLEFLREANTEPQRMQNLFQTLGQYIDAVRLMYHLSVYLNNGQQFMDRWKEQIGAASAGPPIDAHLDPLPAAQRMASGLVEISEGDPRKRG